VAEGTRHLYTATLIVTGITIACKLLGFAREAAVAAVFGATRTTDAYLVAAGLPNILFTLVASAAATVAIPVLIECRSMAGENAQYHTLVASALNGLLLAAAAITGVGLAVTPLLVRVSAPGFDPGQVALTTMLARLLMPSVIFTAVAVFFKSVLQSHGYFAAPAAMAVPYNLILMGVALTVGRRWGTPALAVATTLAAASQLIVQVPALKRRGFKYEASLDWHHPGLRRMLRLVRPVLFGVGADELNMVVERALASSLTEGSVAALSFAETAWALPHDLLVLPLLTVLYPRLAHHTAAGDMKAYAQLLENGLNALSFLIIPVTLGLLTLRVEFISLLYGRGTFDTRAISLTVGALLLYGLGQPFQAWRHLLTRAFYARQDTKTPVAAGILQVVINILANVALVGSLGHTGLALGTSVSAIACTVYLIVRSRTNGPELRWGLVVAETARQLAAGAIMVLVLVLMGRVLPTGQAGGAGFVGWLTGLTRFGCAGVIGGAVFVGFSWLLGSTTARAALNLAAGTIRRRLAR
jgi:putative peptidoglycan lipid II flippase